MIWLERRGAVKTSSPEWFSNDTFQLQRMVHEGLDLGEWEGCTGSRAVPFTKKGQMLAILDTTDPKHPRLMNPWKKEPETSGNDVTSEDSNGSANLVENSAETIMEYGHMQVASTPQNTSQYDSQASTRAVYIKTQNDEPREEIAADTLGSGGSQSIMHVPEEVEIAPDVESAEQQLEEPSIKNHHTISPGQA